MSESGGLGGAAPQDYSNIRGGGFWEAQPPRTTQISEAEGLGGAAPQDYARSCVHAYYAYSACICMHVMHALILCMRSYYAFMGSARRKAVRALRGGPANSAEARGESQGTTLIY